MYTLQTLFILYTFALCCSLNIPKNLSAYKKNIEKRQNITILDKIKSSIIDCRNIQKFRDDYDNTTSVRLNVSPILPINPDPLMFEMLIK